MDSIARAVEPALSYRHEMPEPDDNPPSVGGDVQRRLRPRRGARREGDPRAHVSGRTASDVARLRPRRPIVGLTHHQGALRNWPSSGE